ncbi:MAG TPA: hypothetical protein VK742_08665 [Candidatus Sulfotelmatobacter sp.]|jgi:hypothetical protein|nr:hypothetical protein [Candidatus Sulfotelmatobacter sp.]
MHDSGKKQPAINTDRAKPICAVQATKSGNPATIPVTQKKPRYFLRLIIVLLSLVAIAILLNKSHSALARSYVGVAIALCVVACGVFLVRRFLRILAEEDKLQEQLLAENQAAFLPLQPNPAEPQRRPPAPPTPGRVLK